MSAEFLCGLTGALIEIGAFVLLLVAVSLLADYLEGQEQTLRNRYGEDA